jgi:hypothetical protein
VNKPVEAADLRAIRLKAGPHIEDDDWGTSEALKQRFAQAKLRRDPMFLTPTSTAAPWTECSAASWPRSPQGSHGRR